MADPKRALAEYFERSWGLVERGMEEAVQRSLSRVKVPRREQLQEFTARLERMEKRLDELEGKGGE